MKKSHGFTLIELLVVIAIIGVLASIVITSVNIARVKAADAKIEAELANLRNATEIYYVSNAHYGTASSTCNPLTGTFFSDTVAGISKYITSPTIKCNSSGKAWAAQDNLTATSSYWCVDSKGSSKEVTSVLGASVVCP